MLQQETRNLSRQTKLTAISLLAVLTVSGETTAPLVRNPKIAFNEFPTEIPGAYSVTKTWPHDATNFVVQIGIEHKNPITGKVTPAVLQSNTNEVEVITYLINHNLVSTNAYFESLSKEIAAIHSSNILTGKLPGENNIRLYIHTDPLGALMETGQLHPNGLLPQKVHDELNRYLKDGTLPPGVTSEYDFLFPYRERIGLSGLSAKHLDPKNLPALIRAGDDHNFTGGIGVVKISVVQPHREAVRKQPTTPLQPLSPLKPPRVSFGD